MRKQVFFPSLIFATILFCYPGGGFAGYNPPETICYLDLSIAGTSESTEEIPGAFTGDRPSCPRVALTLTFSITDENYDPESDNGTLTLSSQCGSCATLWDASTGGTQINLPMSASGANLPRTLSYTAYVQGIPDTHGTGLFTLSFSGGGCSDDDSCRITVSKLDIATSLSNNPFSPLSDPEFTPGTPNEDDPGIFIPKGGSKYLSIYYQHGHHPLPAVLPGQARFEGVQTPTPAHVSLKWIEGGGVSFPLPWTPPMSTLPSDGLCSGTFEVTGESAGSDTIRWYIPMYDSSVEDSVKVTVVDVQISPFEYLGVDTTRTLTATVLPEGTPGALEWSTPQNPPAGAGKACFLLDNPTTEAYTATGQSVTLRGKTVSSALRDASLSVTFTPAPGGTPIPSASVTTTTLFTVVDISLASPAPNASFQMDMTSPTMPSVTLSAQVSPSGITDPIQCKFKIGDPQNRAMVYENIPEDGSGTGTLVPYEHPGVLSSDWVSSTSWKVAFGPDIYGGHVTSATLGLKISGEEIIPERKIRRDYFIVGNALSTLPLRTYIWGKQYGDYSTTICLMSDVISIKESSRSQFSSNSGTNMSYPWYPLAGGLARGVMQIEKGNLSEDARGRIWSWKRNVDQGMSYVDECFTTGVNSISSSTLLIPTSVCYLRLDEETTATVRNPETWTRAEMKRLEGYNRFNGGLNDRYFWWCQRAYTNPQCTGQPISGWVKFGYIAEGGGTNGYRDYNNDGDPDPEDNPYHIPAIPGGEEIHGPNVIAHRAAIYADAALAQEATLPPAP